MKINFKNNDYLSIIIKIIALIFFYFFQQVPNLILQLAILHKMQYQFKTQLLTTGIFIITIILTVGILWLVLKKSQVFQSQQLTKKSWTIIILGIIATVIVNLLLVNFMQPSNGNDNISALTTIMKAFPLIFVIYVVFIAPISEEILFRGLFINWFFADHLYLGTVCSSLLFGILHTSSDPIYFLSKCLLGFVLSLVYLRTKNIKASILVHFGNNLLALFI
ncbi:CPBP family intramembrane glutamic endopeptidase [Bombilactobacillus thymidiniphilus]|uniref:CPBP family intramembrane metalloprotease n=1 Tax=Bombilactobacillus thymidiniphilus TaxID=2923363 RepID=A0ABY4PEC0_9LACO|nr:type II CAAX endopeptidase family protein [Bombilactobacillus thymidiniphilus]UQS83856.1 CPBP family intramembrane metalloprotease [Bombilactobacillus thymidiniphilus]